MPENTEMIGLSGAFTNNAKIIAELASKLKVRFPNVPIVLGGVYASTLPLKSLSDNVDYVVRGEGETPLLKLAAGVDPHKIKGLIFKEGKEIIDNGIAEHIEDMDSIPFPARHLLPVEIYLNRSSRGDRKKKALSLITSRGCPFDCDFCSIHPVYGRNWRARSPENIIEEIKFLLEKYQIQHLEFEDDNLTLSKERFERILDELINLEHEITWSAPNGVRIDTLNYEILKKIKKSGCTYLMLPVESGDPAVLKAMNKKSDLDYVTQIVNDCVKLDINVNIAIIIGHPAEDRESFEKTLKYCKNLKKNGVNLITPSIIKVYPGTKLFRFCRDKNYIVDDNCDERKWFQDDYVGVITNDFSEKDVLERIRLIRLIMSPLHRFPKWLISSLAPLKIFMPRHIRDLIKNCLRKIP